MDYLRTPLSAPPVLPGTGLAGVSVLPITAVPTPSRAAGVAGVPGGIAPVGDVGADTLGPTGPPAPEPAAGACAKAGVATKANPTINARIAFPSLGACRPMDA